MSRECHKIECPKHQKTKTFCNEIECYRMQNLCDKCIGEFPICEANYTDVTYGDAVGNDNIITCTKFVEDTLWKKI
jgi:hypothetical protein